MTLDETARYTVRDGKVVKEEFFYHVEDHHQPNNRRQPWQPNSTSSSGV